MFTTGASHSHNSTTTILHRSLHIAEVTLDTTVTGQCDEFRDTLHCIHQDIVCPEESLLQGNLSIRIDITETFIVHNQKSIHVLTHLLYPLQSLYDLTLLLKVEWNRHHTNCQQSHILCHTSHHRSSTSTSAATHTSSHKDHLGAIV